MPSTRRFDPAIAASVLLLSCALFAQHGGHGGGRGGASGSPSAAPADNTDLSGFNHAVQVQANQFQVTQFHTASKNTANALKQAHDLAQMSELAQPPSDLPHRAIVLNDALDEAQKSNKGFVNMLTDAQVAGLKKLLKELNKAESALAKQQKPFAEQLQEANADRKSIGADADKLEKALNSFQTSQFNLAKEMGIQDH